MYFRCPNCNTEQWVAVNPPPTAHHDPITKDLIVTVTIPKNLQRKCQCLFDYHPVAIPLPIPLPEPVPEPPFSVSDKKYFKINNCPQLHTIVDDPICICCFDNYSLIDIVYYQNKSNDMWIFSPFCKSCMKELHRTRWTILKEAITGADCLKSFRHICEYGLPLWLTERDVNPENADEVLVNQICYTDNTESAWLYPDITEAQRDQLINDLRSITDVTNDAIKSVCDKYWTDDSHSKF
jgi:hypothetical protein